MGKTIITCALTGAANSQRVSSAVPITPKQIADEAIAAVRAGAAIVHIHVRDPESGSPSMETKYYRETVNRIRDSGVEVLINLTTGPGARYTPSDENPKVATPESTIAHPEDRVEHVLELRPDICSLDVATFNFGEHAFVNIPDHLDKMAHMVQEAGVKPEMEVFDLGHIRLANEMIKKGTIKGKPLFQLCLGIPWGAPGDVETMTHMRNSLPHDAVWSGFAISRNQFPSVAWASTLGGHVRVGLEDNLYLSRGVLADGNAVLVERAVSLLELLGKTPATPKEAKFLLELK